MRKLVSMIVGAGSVLCALSLASWSAHAQRPLGVDVYAGSGTINWSTVSSASITFAWAKATEGTYYQDANFAANQINGKAAGVYMGAYDFSRPDLYSPVTEANYFWNYAGNYIKNDGKTLMPMLDVETFNGYVGASSYADWVNQWCYCIQTNAAALGVTVTPVIYISACHGCFLDSSVSQWIPWIADYNGQNPQTSTPWTTCTSCEEWGPGVWTVWQFTSSAVIPGVPGNSAGHCDEDVFNGTSFGLVSALIAGAIAIANQPVSVIVAVGGTATFEVGAMGTGMLHYQWRFNRTNIAGATADTYAIIKAQQNDAGAYSVLITNSLGSVESEPAYLAVLANAPNAVLAPPGLVNWWPADDTPLDIFGAYNATPDNGLSYTNGEVGSAFHFDGSSGYLLVNGLTNIPPPWTVCLWVNRQDATSGSAALMGDGTYALKLEQWQNTRQVGITQSGVADYLFSPNYTVPANTWTHLAFVGTSTSVTLYTNGVLEGSVAVANFPLPRASIGADLLSGPPTDFMRGSLDEIQVFNRALSGSEIYGICQAGSAGLVRSPQFTGATSAGHGQIQLNLRGQTGKTFTLYVSTNLWNWTTLETISNPTGAINYTNSTASSQEKFYRASQP